MHTDKKVAHKKRLLTVFTIGAGAGWIIFCFLISGGDRNVLALMVPAAGLVCFFSLRMMKVCPSCGRIVNSGMWYTKAEYCTKCGARLD